MAFRGFLVESKAYVDYDAATLSGKLRFWFDYPFAALRFYGYSIWDSRVVLRLRVVYYRRFVE